MNEWTATAPIVDLPVDPLPTVPAARRTVRAIPRWQQAIAAVLIICGAWIVLIALAAARIAEPAMPYVKAFLLLAAIAVAMITVIAWRSGRLM